MKHAPLDVGTENLNTKMKVFDCFVIFYQATDLLLFRQLGFLQLGFLGRRDYPRPRNRFKTTFRH